MFKPGRATLRRVYQNWPALSGEISEQYSYDIIGNLIKYSDPNRNINEDGATATYKYDELNRIIEVKDALNQVTKATYTILGNISSIILKENTSSTSSINLYTKSYDELGELQKSTDPMLQSVNYIYNTTGLNIKTIDRNGSIGTAAYDGLNQRKETITTSSDNLISLGYKYCYNNPYGYVNEQKYSIGSLITQNQYTYNATGQIIQKNVLGSSYINSNLKLQYDASGRIGSIGAGVQNSNYFYTNYKYTNDRFTGIQTTGTQTANTAENANAVYEYYPDGKLKKITYPKLNDGTYLTSEYI